MNLQLVAEAIAVLSSLEPPPWGDDTQRRLRLLQLMAEEEADWPVGWSPQSERRVAALLRARPPITHEDLERELSLLSPFDVGLEEADFGLLAKVFSVGELLSCCVLPTRGQLELWRRRRIANWRSAPRVIAWALAFDMKLDPGHGLGTHDRGCHFHYVDHGRAPVRFTFDRCEGPEILSWERHAEGKCKEKSLPHPESSPLGKKRAHEIYEGCLREVGRISTWGGLSDEKWLEHFVIPSLDAFVAFDVKDHPVDPRPWYGTWPGTREGTRGRRKTTPRRQAFARKVRPTATP